MFRIIALTAAFILSVGSSSVSAKIWRINNNTGIAADFTTLQAAHDAATAGDTLHIEGSPYTYAGITFSKKLVVIGPGYFLDENPNTQALAQTAKVNSCNFNLGAEGSVITGLDFNAQNLNIYTNNIVIARNKFSDVSGAVSDQSVGTVTTLYMSNNSGIPVTNIIITQNYGLRVNIAYPSTGILITNNYISYGANYGDATTNQSIVMHVNSSALIQNNIIRRGRITAYNSSFYNNIMLAGTVEGTANSFFNNIGNSTQFGTADGNKSNVTMTSVFNGTGSSDAQWKLKTGSPATGAGSNNADAGMYGGNTPYVVAGQPSMPAIYYFENSPVGSSSDPIKVTVKVKAAGN